MSQLVDAAAGSGSPGRLAQSYWPADTSVPVVEWTVGQLLRDVVAEVPDATALVAGVAEPERRRRWSYAELLTAAEGVAGGLLEHVEPGERLGIWAPKVPEWQVVQFGAALAGLTVVTLNPAHTAAEAAYSLGQSRCAAVVTASRSGVGTSPESSSGCAPSSRTCAA